MSADLLDDIMGEILAGALTMPKAPKPVKPAKLPKPAKEPKVSKSAAVLQAAQAGTMPIKPVICSPNRSNQTYQAKLDAISAAAEAGASPEAIEALRPAGTNTYAKMVNRYADAVVAFLASKTTTAAAA